MSFKTVIVFLDGKLDIRQKNASKIINKYITYTCALSQLHGLPVSFCSVYMRNRSIALNLLRSGVN